MLATKSLFRNIVTAFDLEYLLLGGGGGGGGNDAGGGAGGYRLGSDTLTSETSGGSHVGAGDRESPVAADTASHNIYNITLGAGGAAGNPGSTGGNTIFASTTGPSVNLIAYGGGGGSYLLVGDSTNIGSGGGGSVGHVAGVVTDNTDQGFNGGAYQASAKGGGGGGAGEAGNTDGQRMGGDGLFSNITGTNIQRGGGGGGAAHTLYDGGGDGGGGDADTAHPSSHDNKGGGGGGGHNITARPGKEGVIVLKVPSTVTATFEAGVTWGSDGSNSTAIVSVTGYNIYNITAVTTTKTVTFS